jgi:hypothetical protein
LIIIFRDGWRYMNSRLFKNHSGKAPGKFEAEVYCPIHEVSKFAAATPPEGEFQQPFSNTGERFKNHCGKAQGKCKGEVYCDIHEPAVFFAATPPEWIFQQAFQRK